MTVPSDLEHLLTHADWLTRLARRLVADAATADDLVQETWVAALRRPPDPDRPARPWLSSVVRRLAALRLRRQGVRSGYRPVAGDQTPATDEAAARVEQERALADQVLALEEPYRSAVLASEGQEKEAERVLVGCHAAFSPARKSLGSLELRHDRLLGPYALRRDELRARSRRRRPRLVLVADEHSHELVEV